MSITPFQRQLAFLLGFLGLLLVALLLLPSLWQGLVLNGLVLVSLGYVMLRVAPWHWFSNLKEVQHTWQKIAGDAATAKTEQGLHRRRLRMIAVLAFLIVDSCLFFLLYFLWRGQHDNIFVTAPYILIFTWLILGLYTLLWHVIDGKNPVQSLRAGWQSMQVQLDRPKAILFDPDTRMIGLLLVEVALVLGMGYLAADIYVTDDPTRQLRGIEAEWLTSYVYQADFTLRDEGYISHWNPWFEYGEPLLANPFSFIFNPFSSLPGLINGGTQGILQSLVIYSMLAGLGGWFLARVLGLSSLSRVLLGLLMIGKGNMHAMIGYGYYQLGVSQAWIPWAIAGFLACAYYPQKRWPPILTAVAMALMFWAGNIWYTLPTALSMGMLAFSHAFFINAKVIDLRVYVRWAYAAVLTIGLTAITLIPIWIFRDRIGGHPDFQLAREAVDVSRLFPAFWESDHVPYYDGTTVGQAHFYYSFVVPAWLLVLLFVYIPPIWPLTYRAALPEHWRVWSVGAVLAVFFTLWGGGDNWFVLDLYERFELIRQWRFVGRVLAVASFWIAVLVVMRLDGLIRALFNPMFSKSWRRILIFALPQLIAMAILTNTAMNAGVEVAERWGNFGWTEGPKHYDYSCAEWLRERFPDEQLAVYRPKYDATTAFLDHRIRMMPIEADFEIIPDDSTIGSLNLRRILPPYGFGWAEREHAALIGLGYRQWEASPTNNDLDPLNPDTTHCVWERYPYYDYAFAVPLRYFEKPRQKLDPTTSRPVTVLSRDTDDVRVLVDTPRTEPMVIVIQELAYPGWEMKVNGERQEYESVGGFLGVVLPRGTEPVEVSFHFQPLHTYSMAYISLGTILFIILALLRAERLPGAIWRRFNTEYLPPSPPAQKKADKRSTTDMEIMVKSTKPITSRSTSPRPPAGMKKLRQAAARQKAEADVSAPAPNEKTPPEEPPQPPTPDDDKDPPPPHEPIVQK